jgi:steroid delta-isomerase-like uncharacterized protein
VGLKEIGSLARPDDIRFTEALPKTRSGKIMRRLLRELATHGEIKGDITTLEDFTVIAKLREAEDPDMHWAVSEQIAEGDKVVTRFTWTGTHRDTFLGIPATGKRVEVKGVVIDRLEAGKMADSRILMDTLGLMQQLGVIPAPPAAS